MGTNFSGSQLGCVVDRSGVVWCWERVTSVTGPVKARRVLHLPAATLVRPSGSGQVWEGAFTQSYCVVVESGDVWCEEWFGARAVMRVDALHGARELAVGPMPEADVCGLVGDEVRCVEGVNGRLALKDGGFSDAGHASFVGFE